ncbi:hypothetical protein OROGR_014115 [Orobanche gracilis]
MARGRGRVNTERGRGRGRGRGRIPIEPEQPARVPVIGAVETPESYGIELPEFRQSRWERLGGKKMFPTRWSDEECMNAIGIKDDVMKFLERIGWAWMMTRKWVTYRSLTLEFFSTLVVRHDPISHEPSALIFRLNNQDRRLTIQELENVYHLKTGGEYHVNRFKCENYWRSMVEFPGNGSRYYVPKAAKGSSLRNQVLRYLHKVIANTICGRKETGPITLRELYVLTHMLDGTVPATGVMLAEHFDDVATKPKREIWVGGLITPIALHFGISLDQRTPLAGNMLLSFPVVRIMGILEYDSRIIFIQHDNDRFLLPNTPLTTIDSIRDMRNLQMATEEHRQARIAAELISTRYCPLDRNVRARHAEEESDERMEEEEAYERGPENEDAEEEEQEKQAGERPESSRQGEERYAPAQRTLREEVVALRNEFASFRDETQRKQNEILSLVRQMHEWLVQQRHFPPPPH